MPCPSNFYSGGSMSITGTVTYAGSPYASTAYVHVDQSSYTLTSYDPLNACAQSTQPEGAFLIHGAADFRPGFTDAAGDSLFVTSVSGSEKWIFFALGQLSTTGPSGTKFTDTTDTISIPTSSFVNGTFAASGFWQGVLQSGLSDTSTPGLVTAATINLTFVQDVTIGGPPPNITGGQVASFQLTATVGSGLSCSFVYAVTGGSLPAGLTLSPTGLLSGTPTTIGPYSFTVTASSTGCMVMGTQTFSGNIVPYITINDGLTFGSTSAFVPAQGRGVVIPVVLNSWQLQRYDATVRQEEEK